MSKNKCSLKVISTKGKELHGTAAILHMTSRNGGFDNFLKNFANKVSEDAVNSFIEEQRKPIKQPLRLVK
jgi:hypothetical protein